MQPVIKWTGSKRHLTQEILKYFPKEINNYYEPCVGGGSVLLALLRSQVPVHRFIASDTNADLINLWSNIQFDPNHLITAYRKHWNNLQNHPAPQNYYNEVRKKFNNSRLSEDFVFLNRTCMNGLVRYNNQGNFNSAFHYNRPGIHPDKLSKIFLETSKLLQSRNVSFHVGDFKDCTPMMNDCVYLDPPYNDTDGMYHGKVKTEDVVNYLRKLKSIGCTYLLTYDGIRNEESRVVKIPEDLYDEHIMLKNGTSGFNRLDNKYVIVKESLYIRRSI